MTSGPIADKHGPLMISDKEGKRDEEEEMDRGSCRYGDALPCLLPASRGRRLHGRR